MPRVALLSSHVDYLSGGGDGVSVGGPSPRRSDVCLCPPDVRFRCGACCGSACGHLCCGAASGLACYAAVVSVSPDGHYCC